MSGSLDFTGQPIQETYKRVVQYDNGILYDGTGSLLGALNITGSQAVTASYALTASYLENITPPFPFTGSAQITGSLGVTGSGRFTNDLYVDGTLYANTQVIITQSYYSGSNIFGDELTDTHQFTGSVQITGSLAVQGNTFLNGPVNMGLTSRGGTNILYYDVDNGEITQDRLPGSTGQIFFNDNDNFQTDSGLSWDNTNKVLITTGSLDVSNTITISGDNTNNPTLYLNNTENPSGPISMSADNTGLTFNGGIFGQDFNVNGLFPKIQKAVSIGYIAPTQLEPPGKLTVQGTGSFNGITLEEGVIARFISSDGTTRFNLDDTGSLGLNGDVSVTGSGNFTSNLTVTGSTILSGSVSVENITPLSNIVSIGNAGTDYVFLGVKNPNNLYSLSQYYPFPGIGIYSPNSAASSTRGSVIVSYISGSSVGNFQVWSMDDDGNKTERLVLNNAGLDINGTGKFSGNLTVTGSATNSLLVKGSGATSATTALRVENANASGSLVVLDDGNVGIGTTTPATKLEVNGNIKLSSTAGYTSTPSYIWLGNDYSSGETRDKLKIYLYNTGTEQYGFSVGTNSDIQHHSNGRHDFYVANNRKVQITSGGLFLISGATTTFSVDNGASFQAKNSSGTYETYLWPRWTDNITYLNYGLGGFNIRNNSSTSTMFLTNGGNVGIGTSTPLYKLDVNGTFRTTSDTTLANATTSIIKNVNNYPVFEGQTASAQLGFSRSGTGKVTYIGSDSTYLFRLWDESFVSTYFTVLHTGNVGIGTASPGYKLHVIGDLGADHTFTLAADNGSNATASRIKMYSHNNFRGAGTFLSGVDATWFMGAPYTDFSGGFIIGRKAEASFSSDSATYGNALLTVKSSGYVGIGTSTPAANLQIKGSGTTSATTALRVENSSATTSMVILDNGNVGIGTSSPTQSLNVAGKVLVGSVDTYGDTHTKMYLHSTTGAVNFVLNPRPTATDIYYRVKIGVDVSYGGSFYIDHEAAGRIIEAYNGGTTLNLTPVVSFGNKVFTSETNARGLQLYSTLGYSSLIRFTNADSGTTSTDGALIGLMEGGNTFKVWNYESQAMIFGTSNTEQMRITSTGNVGIGTTSPAYKLEVVGDSYIQTQIRSTNNAAGLKLVPSSGNNYEIQATNANEFLIYDRSASVYRLLINGSGNVVIGNSITPLARFHIIGSGTTSATNALLVQNASSTNLASLNDAGQLVLGTINSGSANDQLIIGKGNGWASMLLDAGYAGEVGSKIGIISRRDYGQPFYIEQGSGGGRIIDTWEGGAGMTLPTIIAQGVRAKWQTLEAYGTYHHIHSSYGGYPAGIKLTNATTNTGSTDGIYMGLWTSGVNARLWNYETNGSWNIGVGNIQQATITTSSFSISSVLTLPPQDPLPTANVPSASFATSGSGANLKPYFWNGATWTALF